MDTASFRVVGRFAMVGVLCAGALVGSACGRDGAMGANSVVEPSAIAAATMSLISPSAHHSMHLLVQT